MVGDADGVVVMPSARAAELAALGERLLRDEQDVLASIADSTIDRSWVLCAMDDVTVVDPGQTCASQGRGRPVRASARRNASRPQDALSSRAYCEPLTWECRTTICAAPAGRTSSTWTVLVSVSPSATGPRWLQCSQTRTVTRSGTARTTCDSATPMVWPP